MKTKPTMMVVALVLLVAQQQGHADTRRSERVRPPGNLRSGQNDPLLIARDQQRRYEQVAHLSTTRSGYMRRLPVVQAGYDTCAQNECHEPASFCSLGQDPGGCSLDAYCCAPDSCCGAEGCCGTTCCCPTGCCTCGGGGPWACRTHTWRYFGEFLFLRPRNAEVPYAVGIDGPIVPPPDNNPIQVTPIAIVDLYYEPGGRVGFARALDECSNLGATYTHFESRVVDDISITAPDVIRSLVSHPSSLSASTDFLYGRGDYGIDFQLADVEYRRIFSCGELHSMSYIAGVRYTHLTQDFEAHFESLGTETVTTGIEFHGAGLRVGWEGERHARKCGLMIYGRATASLVAGEVRAEYLQVESFDPTVVDTGWHGGRIITMLDLELGAGWSSPCGRYRFTAGYIINEWFNTVKTDEWIAAVQANDFDGLGDTLTFDGLTGRAEFRF